MEHVDRRQFLKLAGAALAVGASFAPMRASPILSRSRAGPTGLARVPLLPLRRRPGDRVAEGELVARAATVQVGGSEARLLTYNGSFPGPLIQLREGERLRLRFRNELTEPTNLHFHGLHVDPAVDNPFLHVPPGGSHTYEFDLPEGSAGTFWYHPHYHGSVAAQLWAGLAGPLVVRGAVDDLPELKAAAEYVLMLKDLTLAGGRPAHHTRTDWADGKQGEWRLVNGMQRPVLYGRRRAVRLRLVNGSNARSYRLRLEDGEPLYLIGTDGGFIEKPVAMEELLLVPGERADVLVRLTRREALRLLDMPYSRGGVPGGAEPETLLTLMAPEDGRPPLPLPVRLASVEVLQPEGAAVVRSVVFGMFLINNRSYNPERPEFSARLGDLEVWEIKSFGDMDHPFHLHTYPFQVLERNGVPLPFRAWRDTVNLRPGDRVRIAVPLRDFTGRTLFHCHIAEHADRGMMAVLEVGPSLWRSSLCTPAGRGGAEE